MLAHQRTRENQSRHLRAQALALQTLVDPIPQPLPPSRSEVAAAQRAASVEVAKDRWNEEVENAVRWVQNTDWVDVREDLEARVAGLWARAFGGAVDGAEKAGEKLEPAARQVEAAARDAGSSIASAGKAAFDKARERGARYESTMEDKALEARLTGRRQIEKAEAEAKKKASEAQGVIASALEKGRDKAHEVVDKVKTAVGLAEEEGEVGGGVLVTGSIVTVAEARTLLGAGPA